MGLDEVLNNPRYLLLAPMRVEGYHTLSKQWATFVISNLSDHLPLMRSDVLDTLYLDKTLAESLKADFTQYFQERRKFLAERNTTTNADIGARGTFGRRLILQFDGK